MTVVAAVGLVVSGKGGKGGEIRAGVLAAAAGVNDGGRARVH